MSKYNTRSLLLSPPKNGLVLAHLNICNLRNNVKKIARVCLLDNIHVLALSETNLDTAFNVSEMAVLDMGSEEEIGTSMVAKMHFMFRNTFQLCYWRILWVLTLKKLWVMSSVHLPYYILVRCCRRPRLWLNLQEFLQPLTVLILDYIFTDIHELCSQVVGCSDHNLIVLTRKTKMPKYRVRIVYHRSWKRFYADSFGKDVKDLKWSVVYQENDWRLIGKKVLQPSSLGQLNLG